MNSTPIYTLDKVCHDVSPSFSLRVEQLQIEPGETLCLVGPTGAGKSTLLRLLTGLHRATSGSVRFHGMEFGGPSTAIELTRRIATAHQNPILLSESVRSNVEYGLRVRSAVDSHSRCTQMLDDLGLSHLAEQDAHTLSGGQRQLVAIARALVISPEVLLLDEPTSQLDPGNVARVESVIAEHRRKTGMTIVWVTHNLFQARRMGTRGGLLLQGDLVEVATIEQFFRSPREERTSMFIHGKMVY